MLASRCGDHCTQKWFRAKPPPRFYPFTTTCMASSSLINVLLHPDTAENVNVSVTFWWSPFVWIRWPSDLFPEDQDTHYIKADCQQRPELQPPSPGSVFVTSGAFPVSEDLSRRDQSLCANSTALPVLTCVRKTSQLLDFLILKVGASVCSCRYWVCICGGVLRQGWTRARGHPRALVLWAV